MLTVIREMGLWGGIMLGMLEILRRPRGLLCDCPAFPLAPLHLPSRLLFLQALLTSIWALCWTLQTGVDVFIMIFWAIAAYEWWRWWKHSRNERKKLGEKALAVVKEVAGRLVVTPVPHGA